MSENGPGNLLTQLEQSVPEGWRLRFERVAMRLLLGSNKMADIYASGRAAIDTADGRSIVSKALAEAVAAREINDELTLANARSRYLDKILSEQENMEAVVIGSQKYIAALPPPDGEDNDSQAIPNEIDLDEDWVASFTKEAEKATSDSLRDRLSKVLAGEVSAPGSYPRAVFRKIVELDKKEIEAIRKLSTKSIKNIIFSCDDSEDFTLQYKVLVEAGLINTNAFSHPLLNFTGNGKDEFLLPIVKGDYTLILQSKTSSLALKELHYLNRAGIAAFSLLSELDDITHLKTVARHFANEKLTIDLCKILSIADGQMVYKAIEKLQ
mgnify:CR=1 FL=1|tara:strand:+ start:3480 stop:4454 length:975 start_codon:yes stop_codon:yes gene_type:complete